MDVSVVEVLVSFEEAFPEREEGEIGVCEEEECDLGRSLREGDETAAVGGDGSAVEEG